MTKLKLELLTDIGILLMVEGGIRSGISPAIHQYFKAKNKYMKNYKNKGLSYLKYWGVNNLNGWAVSKCLVVSGFKWAENTSQFKEVFINTTMRIVIENIFLKLMLSILKNYIKLAMIYHFYHKE